MNWLIDAHLPRRLLAIFRAAGQDVIHTLDLPSGNRTPDYEIIAIAERERRVVVTKDTDFVNSFLIHRRPSQLLMITTGNIANVELERLLVQALPTIIAAFAQHAYLELNRTSVIVHV